MIRRFAKGLFLALYYIGALAALALFARIVSYQQ